jgi:hypothetical protein
MDFCVQMEGHSEFSEEVFENSEDTGLFVSHLSPIFFAISSKDIDTITLLIISGKIDINAKKLRKKMDYGSCDEKIFDIIDPEDELWVFLKKRKKKKSIITFELFVSTRLNTLHCTWLWI